MYFLTAFIGQNFKKALRADPKIQGCAILHLKWPVSLERWPVCLVCLTLINLVTFIHVYLNAKNESQMSIH